jgi:hypothetical protein
VERDPEPDSGLAANKVDDLEAVRRFGLHLVDNGTAGRYTFLGSCIFMTAMPGKRKPKQPTRRLLSAEAVEKPRSQHRGTLNLIPFKPRQSGNPGGRTVENHECQAMAREASPEAMERLIHIMRHSRDERAALLASDMRRC